jgi:cyclophilin family peptidyl-prolyl cis-trans isomerase
MTRFLSIFLLTVSWLRADFIAADFRTTQGDFTVFLDYLNSPLAVANFIHLAGKDDDILETAVGVPEVGSFGHDRQLYRPTSGSDVQRLPLTVALVPATPTFRAYYGIYQNQTLIGGVETRSPRGYYPDITGEDRIRLENIRSRPSDPLQYRITLKYPRPWLDARNQRIKEAPMYRAMRVQRVVSGRRLYAGTMTKDRLEHPGYHFQDEVARNPGNLANPYGTPFGRSVGDLSGRGVLAMDTLGPNRNGSGFFITAVAEPSFNGRYTAFGQVATPLDLQVVQSIVNSPVDNEGSLTSPVFILDISIRRSGVTANAFMEGFRQKDLPGIISPVQLAVERSGETLALVAPLRPQSFQLTYLSSDLINYNGGSLQAQGPDATEGFRSDLTLLTQFSPRSFFKGFSTSLPRWPSAEFDFENARLFFSVTSGVDTGTMNLFFSSILQPPPDEEDDGLVRMIGTYNIDMVIQRTGPGNVSEFVPSFGQGSFVAIYDSSQGPFRGRLEFTNVTGPLNVGQITMHFDSGVLFNNPQANPALLIRRFDASTTDPEVPVLNYSGIFQKLR